MFDEVRSHLETLEADSAFFPQIIDIARPNTSVEWVGHKSTRI